MFVTNLILISCSISRTHDKLLFKYEKSLFVLTIDIGLVVALTLSQLVVLWSIPINDNWVVRELNDIDVYCGSHILITMYILMGVGTIALIALRNIVGSTKINILTLVWD